jgi:hypothetical protein
MSGAAVVQVFRRRVGHVRVTGLGVLIAAFVLLRLAATVGGTTRFSDTGTYFPLNFLGNDERLWTVPLVWNLLGSDQLRQVFQIGLALVVWPLLATTVARLISNRWLALIGAAGILLIGLVPQVTGWDSTMLSESFLASLLVLLCALLLRLSIARSPRLVAFTLLVTVCWAFTGQSSALLFLAVLPFVLVFCVSRLTGRERVAVAAVLLLVGGWTAYALTRDTGASQAVPTYNAIQIIENRIAPDPAALHFLTARGMPRSPAIAEERGDFPGGTSPLFSDPVFMTWIHQSFRSVYAAYLLHRWPSTLTDPFEHTPAAITGPTSSGLPGRSVLPSPLRDGIWGPGPAQIFVWLTALALCASAALIQRARVRCTPVIGLLLFSAAASALLTWNLTGYGPGQGPDELARLFLPVALVLRIAIVLAVTLTLDALLGRRAASVAARIHRVSPSPHRTWVPSRAESLFEASGPLAGIRPAAERIAAELRPHSPLRIAGAALALTLVALPELDHGSPAGPATLTPARLLLAVAGTAAIVDVVRERNLRVLWRPLTIALLISLLAGVGLVWSSAATNGCNCRGSAAGLGEFALTAALATYVLARDRGWASRFVWAAAS